MEVGDLWPDAKLQEVFSYLRGSNKIAIPEEWRPVLPTNLVEFFGSV